MDELDKNRLEMEKITREMIALLERRLTLSIDIAAYKQAHGMPIFQPEREQALKDRFLKNVDYPQEVDEFLETLFLLSKRVQTKVMEK